MSTTALRGTEGMHTIPLSQIDVAEGFTRAERSSTTTSKGKPRTGSSGPNEAQNAAIPGSSAR